MKLLHQLGHKYNWALDAFFQNKIGDGFIISAYSIDKEKIGEKLSGYEADAYLPLSLIDLQFYGSKESQGGKLNSYEFHPINYTGKESTDVSTVDAVVAGVKYQEKLGLNNILVPNIYIHPESKGKKSRLIGEINKKIKEKKLKGTNYFMTIPISGSSIRDDEEIEQLLQEMTDMDIVFDGYYIVCEPNLETRKKISVDFKYYLNLNKILMTLKKQGFKVILGFSNVDSLIFSTMSDLDFVSIGTYENLRNFNIKRFTANEGGGPSDGWYYSEKLLNFIRARQLDILRERGVLDLIKNEDNIFSDVILKEGYAWNTHKPDVHKNYLLAISKQLKTIGDIPHGEARIAHTLKLIEGARDIYKKLEEKGVFFDDDSSNYHLPTWLSVLKTPNLGVLSGK